MWFNRKKKEQTQSIEQNYPKVGRYWYCIHYGTCYAEPRNDGDQLIFDVVSHIIQIPPSNWERTTLDGNNGFKTVTTKGAFVVLIMQMQLCNSGSDDSRYYSLYVDGEVIGKFTDEYHDGSSSKTGFLGIETLYEYIAIFCRKQEDEREHPRREAELAESKRKQAEREALEAKKANNILQRL